MRISHALAVALTVTTMSLLVSCGVERENDEVTLTPDQQGDCTCTTTATLFVWSLEGGILTCDDEAVDFTEGVDISGICMDASGFEFTLELNGQTDLAVRGENGSPLALTFTWTGTNPPAEWIAEPTSDQTVPNGGTIQVVVPGALKKWASLGD